MLSFTSPRRHATNGIYLNKHLRTVPIHSTISDLFSLSTNHESLILKCYHHLLPQITEIACPPTTPRMDLAHYFLTTLSPHSARGRLKKHCTHTVKSELYNHIFEHKRADFHLLPSILSTQTSYPIIGMSRSAIKHRLSPLSFLICIRRKLRLPIYPPNTRCTCGHHDHDVFGDHAFCCDKGSKKRTHNTIATDFATILSPALAQAGYIYPNTKLDIKTHLHLRSDPTARPFDISFNPNPTPHHCCPYITIGADITITGTTPPPKRQTSEDIIQTITANADHHLQMHERRKLGRTTKPATATTPPVHGDEVIGELYKKNMVLIPITIDPFARFGPMFQSFLTSTESRPQKPWFTTHRNNKFNRPYANLMYERASKPPCTLGILTSADFFWKQSDSPTRRTF